MSSEIKPATQPTPPVNSDRENAAARPSGGGSAGKMRQRMPRRVYSRPWDLAAIIALFLTLPAILWCVLWAGINTGPWVFRAEPVGLRAWAHYIRTAAPLGVLVIAAAMMLSQIKSAVRGPISMWWAYALFSTIGCAFSPLPLDALYWAACYMAVLAVAGAYLRSGHPLKRAKELNYVTWIATTGILVILMFIARDVLFVERGDGLTGHGLLARLDTVGGAPMSRESGMARFAAIPGVVAFVAIFRSRQTLIRLLCVAVVATSGSMIYLMQSRGAIAAFFGSLVFVLLFVGPYSKRFAGVLLLMAVPLLSVGAVPEHLRERVVNHLTRGQTREMLTSFTGRSYTWRRSLPHILESPALGYGPQADRYRMEEHAHNTYIYALLSSGVLGAAAFTAGLFWAWILFLRSVQHPMIQSSPEFLMVVQAGALLAFFTVRGMPEVSGAMFGVDTMIMVPLLVYLGVLDRQRRMSTRRRAPRAPIKAAVSVA